MSHVSALNPSLTHSLQIFVQLHLVPVNDLALQSSYEICKACVHGWLSEGQNELHMTEGTKLCAKEAGMPHKAPLPV